LLACNGGSGMSVAPDWLPPIISVDGEWHSILLKLHAVFTSDFKVGKKILFKLPVWWDQRVIDGDYEEGFWHLITREDYQKGERLFDPRRAERLPWCGPTISNASDKEIRVWESAESKHRNRLYLWLEHWDYVIVLEKRTFRIGDVYFLITAYYVDGTYNRNKLRKKFDKRIV